MYKHPKLRPMPKPVHAHTGVVRHVSLDVVKRRVCVGLTRFVDDRDDTFFMYSYSTMVELLRLWYGLRWGQVLSVTIAYTHTGEDRISVTTCVPRVYNTHVPTLRRMLHTWWFKHISFPVEKHLDPFRVRENKAWERHPDSYYARIVLYS